MADVTKPTFPIGSTVALKATASEVYGGKAWPGAVAFVRDVKIDDGGFEKIFVVWDEENDWRYTGASPGWTFADHFTLKELPKKTPRPKRITKKDIERIQALDAFMAELSRGVEALADSEGFIIFVAKREPVEGEPNQTIIAPKVFAASHSQDADAVLGIVLSEHMAATFEEMTMLLLEMFGDS